MGVWEVIHCEVFWLEGEIFGSFFICFLVGYILDFKCFDCWCVIRNDYWCWFGDDYWCLDGSIFNLNLGWFGRTGFCRLVASVVGFDRLHLILGE